MSGLDLVTGGHGFIGAHLVALLTARGRRVRVLDTREAAAPDGVETIVGSVTDPDTAARAVDGAERVFHLAAIPELWARDRGVFDRVNRAGTQTMLAAARAGSVGCFVYAASEVVLVARRIADLPARLDETVELPPEALCGAYARSKRAGELAALAAADADFRVCSAIPTVPLGPGDCSRTPPTRMLEDLLAGRMPAYPNVTFDAVDVRDAALGLLLTAEHGRSGARYLLSGHSVAMGELLAQIAAAAGVIAPRLALPGWLAQAIGTLDTGLAALTGHTPRAPRDGTAIARRMRPCSNAKARQELAFDPRPLGETVRDAVAWLRR